LQYLVVVITRVIIYIKKIKYKYKKKIVIDHAWLFIRINITHLMASLHLLFMLLFYY